MILGQAFVLGSPFLRPRNKLCLIIKNAGGILYSWAKLVSSTRPNITRAKNKSRRLLLFALVILALDMRPITNAGGICNVP